MTRRHPQKNTAACWLFARSPVWQFLFQPCLCVTLFCVVVFQLKCASLKMVLFFAKEEATRRRLFVVLFSLFYKRLCTHQSLHLLMLLDLVCRPAAIAEEEMSSRWTGKKSTKEKIHEPSNYSTKETLFYISLGPCFAGALAWTAAVH